MLHHFAYANRLSNQRGSLTAPTTESAAGFTSPTEAWLAVCDDLLWAFNHALSNRLAALTSITKILEYSDTGLDPLLTALSTEITALEETLSLLRLLPRNPAELPEPVRMEDLLPPVVALHRLQSDLRDLEYAVDAQPDTAPVWIEPALLTHAVLLLLAAASRAARRAGGGTVMIRYAGDDERVRLVIESPAGTASAEGADGSWKPMDARVVERLLEKAGGELVENRFAGDPRSGVRFEVSLPTLMAVRNKERAGG